MQSRTSKKLLCKACRRWFVLHPPAADFGGNLWDTTIQKKCHRKKCFECNRKNREYFKGIYLKKKVLATDEDRQNKASKASHTFGATLAV